MATAILIVISVILLWLLWFYNYKFLVQEANKIVAMKKEKERDALKELQIDYIEGEKGISGIPGVSGLKGIPGIKGQTFEERYK